MAQEEQWGNRCRAYSSWHRRHSLARFIGIEQAQLLAMIDVDAALWVEYDDHTKEPVALIETARDRGQSYKPASVMRNLAARCDPTMPAYVSLYTLADRPNPADTSVSDIAGFRVRRIHPEGPIRWNPMTPEEYALFCLEVRIAGARRVDQMLHRRGSRNMPPADQPELPL